METVSRMREIRKRLNITLAELAERLDVPFQYIHKLETGAANPSQDLLIKLNQRLRINLNWLLCGEGEMLKSHVDSNPHT